MFIRVNELQDVKALMMKTLLKQTLPFTREYIINEFNQKLKGSKFYNDFELITVMFFNVIDILYQMNCMLCKNGVYYTQIKLRRK